MTSVYLLMAAALVSAALVSDASATEVPQLPNLQVLPAFEVQMGAPDAGTNTPVALRFSVASANVGAYAFELWGSVIEEQTPEGDRFRSAEQCVSWVSRVCTRRASVGNFVWHAEHGHWHFEDYVSYELRRLAPNGDPDLSQEGLVAPSEKVSFCLLDGRQVERDPPGNDPLRSVPAYSYCTAYRQGLSPGWADEYGWGLYGQQIPIEPAKVPDGTYALVLTINPVGRILESDARDNRSFVLVEISDGGTKARAL